MDNIHTFDEIKRLIIQSDLKAAIEMFEMFFSNNISMSNRVLLIKSRLNEYNSKKSKGILSSENISLEYNLLKSNFLDLVTEFEDISTRNKIIKGKEITPELMLYERSQERNGFNSSYYIEREDVDNELIKNISKRKHSLIIGKPLTGKSRAILHFFQKYRPESNVLIINRESSSFMLPKMDNNDLFVVINDIDNHISSEFFPAFFNTILSKSNIIIIANCRTSAFLQVEDFLGENIALINTIKIPPITKAIEKKLNKEVKNKANKETDDTIGSWFFSLDIYISRYNKLPQLEKEILRAYKCVDIWRRKNEENKQLIREYVELRYERYFNETFSLKEWNKAIKKTVSEGFIVENELTFWIDSAYLDRFITIDESAFNLANEITDYYPQVESYSKIFRFLNYENALLLLNKMLKKKVADAWAFNSLINKGNFLRGLEILEKMNDNEVQPDVITFTSLINKGNFQQGLEILEKMNDNEVQPDIITFNSLINKGNFQQGLEILEKMNDNEVQPDIITFNSLINKGNFQQGLKFLEEMNDKDIKPDVISFTSLMNKGNFQKGLEILEKMNDKDIKPDIFTFTSLIKKGSYQQGLEILETMKENEILPVIFTFNSLINKGNFQQGLDVLERMKDNEIQPDIFTFNSLINKGNFQQGLDVLERMKDNEIQPDVITFTSLIKKGDFLQGLDVLERMKDNEIQPDVITFTSLIKKGDFLQGLDVLERMKDNEIQPDTVTYNTIMNKIQSFDDIVLFIDFLQDNGRVIHFSVIRFFAKKIASKDDILSFLSLVKEKKLEIEIETINILIKKESIIEDVFLVLKEIQKLSLEPNQNTYTILINKVLSLEELRTLFDELGYSIPITEKIRLNLLKKGTEWENEVEMENFIQDWDNLIISKYPLASSLSFFTAQLPPQDY